MAVDLKTVISELQFLNQLASELKEAPRDKDLKKRINELSKQAAEDLRQAVIGIGGEDPLIGT